MMLKIGLTGGIGSGKSTVARIFPVLGIPVYNADLVARRLMNSEKKLIEGIMATFGKEAYKNGELDRNYMASKVFPDQDLLLRLNALVHPAVHHDFIRWCEMQTGTGVPYIVEDAAILVESGAYKQFDVIIVVHAEQRTRIRRVIERDGISEADVRSRMKRQMPDEELLHYADFVIRNNGEELLVPQVLDLHRKFVSLHLSN